MRTVHHKNEQWALPGVPTRQVLKHWKCLHLINFYLLVLEYCQTFLHGRLNELKHLSSGIWVFWVHSTQYSQGLVLPLYISLSPSTLLATWPGRNSCSYGKNSIENFDLKCVITNMYGHIICKKGCFEERLSREGKNISDCVDLKW